MNLDHLSHIVKGNTSTLQCVTVMDALQESVHSRGQERALQIRQLKDRTRLKDLILAGEIRQPYR